jgi:hypothetical protein
VRSETSHRRAPAVARRLTRALLLGACALGAGCQLLVTFETVPEGTGGGGSTSSTTTQGGGGADTTAQGGDTTTGTAQGGDTTTTGTSTVSGMCGTPADCDDGKPCTDDLCDGGKCVHTHINEGMLPPGVTDPPSDCLKTVCEAGEVVEKLDKGQAPDTDLDDCTNTYCLNDGSTMTDPTNEGQPCLPDLNDPCKQNVCVNGMCKAVNLNEGVIIDPGDKNLPSGSGECRDLVCDSGQAVLVPNFLNCVDQVPGNCYVRLCQGNGLCGLIQNAPAGWPCDLDGNGSPPYNGQCDGLGPDFSNCKP